jgi:hypothetical protein
MSLSIQMLFNFVMSESENVFITQVNANKVFSVATDKNTIQLYQNTKDLIDGVKFYDDINNKIKNVSDMGELIEVIKYFLVDNEDSYHCQSMFNIVQALMKICIHRIWSLCYELHPRLRNTPQEAMSDLLNPIETSQKILNEIVANIKKEQREADIKKKQELLKRKADESSDEIQNY